MSSDPILHETPKVPKEEESKVSTDIEEAKNIPDTKLESYITMVRKIHEEMIEKQKKLYFLLEDMSKKTYNPAFYCTEP
jgi:hypothetical protein